MNYKRWRPFLAWILFLGTCVVIGILIYQELRSPLPAPEVTTIVSNAPPKVEPPTPETRATYSVPPTHPRYLIIPKLDINTNIYAVGTKHGAVDAPQTAWGVGWYQNSVLPGTGTGAALIDGHVNDAFNTPGVFYELSKLSSGDDISIIRGDASELHYKAVQTSEEPLGSIDMNKVLSSVEAGKEGLTLITCGGKYDKTAGTYTDRVIVYAIRVS